MKMGFLDLLAAAIQIAIPQPCFDKYVKEYDFFDGPCLKTVISKCLGLCIILGSVLVKVPQIMKLVKANSSVGISLVSVTLELAAITSSFVYGFGKGFPFSAYGEGLFLVIQTIVIAYLTQTYSGKTTQAFTYVGVYAVIISFLMSPAAPMELLQILQACVMPNMVIARAVQIVANYRNASTGQLSAITVALLYVGALTRIFTSIQETGDMLLVLTYIVSSSCSGIILFQIWYYRNSPDKVAARSKSD